MHKGKKSFDKDELIDCGCRCGLKIKKYDSQGREKWYAKNHQNRGRIRSEEYKKKMSESTKGRVFSEEHKSKFIGEKNHEWKGDDVSNEVLHKYVKRHFPKSQRPLCQLCMKNPSQELANITGIYNRELKNWAWLCRSCHSKWDNIFRNLRKK